MADTRQWLKNKRTGLVFPVNPPTFAGGVIDPDLVLCSGPQDETPVRPRIPGADIDMSNWVDPGGGIVAEDLDDEPPASDRIAFQPEGAQADVSAEEVDLDAEGLAIPASPATPVEPAGTADVTEATAPADTTTSNAGTEVADETEVGPSHEHLVLEAIALLDPADPAHFTKGGVPNAMVLTERCGFMVTKELRDKCWAAFVASRQQ